MKPRTVAELRARVAELFGEGALRRSAINIRAGGGAFERFVPPRCHALEIGTYRGLGTAALALFADSVVTVDLAHGKLEAAGEAWDRSALWRALELENIRSVVVRDDEEKRALVESLDFDFAFVDGEHTTAGVALDFELVKRCGRVMFHDYDWSPREKRNDVYHFVSNLDGNLAVHDIFALWTPHA